MGWDCARSSIGVTSVRRALVKTERNRLDSRHNGHHASRYVPISSDLIPYSSLVYSFDEIPSLQLICVGPLVDIYGRFASIKLAHLMEIYPDRIRSIPEFRILPPCVMEGADFCLIPSRDEPFGLVAVESGRKGALGIGSRLGGLGLSPGWVSHVLSDST